MKSGLFIFCLIFGMISCTTGPHRKETISGPTIKTMAHHFNQKSSRIPSSLTDKMKKQNTRDEKLEAYNNKNLYFLTLYSQYDSFKKLSGVQSNDVMICPSFHSLLLTNKKMIEQMSAPYRNLSLQLNTPKGDPALYPEYSLKLDNSSPPLWDLLKENKAQAKNELLSRAIDQHVKNLSSELQELCEFGQSDNYFIFENLISHLKENEDFSTSDAATDALFKTTVFSNMAILKGLAMQARNRSRGIASHQDNTNGFEKEIMYRLDASWMNQYFAEIKNRRGHI